MNMTKLEEIYKEITKATHTCNEAKANMEEIKNQYRKQLVDDCIENLVKVQAEKGTLSERDLEIFILHLTHDVRNLYTQQ